MAAVILSLEGATDFCLPMPACSRTIGRWSLKDEGPGSRLFGRCSRKTIPRMTVSVRYLLKGFWYALFVDRIRKGTKPADLIR